MTQLYNDDSTKLETVLTGMFELIQETRQNMEQLLSNPAWADCAITKNELAILNRIEQDIYHLFGDLLF